jgi:hypothetical protein
MAAALQQRVRDCLESARYNCTHRPAAKPGMQGDRGRAKSPGLPRSVAPQTRAPAAGRRSVSVAASFNVSVRPYTLRKGDTLESIAKKRGALPARGPPPPPHCVPVQPAGGYPRPGGNLQQRAGPAGCRSGRRQRGRAAGGGRRPALPPRRRRAVLAPQRRPPPPRRTQTHLPPRLHRAADHQHQPRRQPGQGGRAAPLRAALLAARRTDCPRAFGPPRLTAPSLRRPRPARQRRLRALPASGPRPLREEATRPPGPGAAAPQVKAGQTILLPASGLSSRDKEILEGIGSVYRWAGRPARAAPPRSPLLSGRLGPRQRRRSGGVGLGLARATELACGRPGAGRRAGEGAAASGAANPMFANPAPASPSRGRS